MPRSLIASVGISGHLALAPTAEVRQGTEPPPAVEPVEVRVTPGLSLQLWPEEASAAPAGIAMEYKS